jgi:hypothetical protein
VQSVENLAWLTDLYTIEGHDDPLMIDRAWSRVEQGLTAAIEALEQLPHVRLDAWLWTGILVPFVIQLFVRDPDWHSGMEIGSLKVSRNGVLSLMQSRASTRRCGTLPTVRSMDGQSR